MNIFSVNIFKNVTETKQNIKDDKQVRTTVFTLGEIVLKLKMPEHFIEIVNKAIDEVYNIMNEGEVHIDHLTEEELDHVKNISNMIADDEVEFLDDEEFKSLIHSVVGES